MYYYYFYLKKEVAYTVIELKGEKCTNEKNEITFSDWT